jgi:hypothetical protein
MVRGELPCLSEAAREVFEGSTTGPIPGGHNYGEGHRDYNEGVKDLWDKHVTQNKIDPAKMTKKQAEDFVSEVKRCSDPRVRRYNLRLWDKFMKEGLRRMPTARGIE